MTMNNETIFKWYNNPAIKFEIIKSLFNRELAVINRTNKDSKVTIRMLKCHNVQHYDFLQKFVIKQEYNNQLFNYYYSLAKYRDGIPKQNWHLQERNNQQWTKEHFKLMVSYDFLLDIDGNFEEMDYAYDSAKSIKNFLDSKKIPYELRFSGCGFHFIIPHRFLPQDLSMNPYYNGDNLYKYCARIAKFFYNDFSDLVDVNIYDSRRICKIPYSLSCYPDDDKAYLCFPMHSDHQFEAFYLHFLDYQIINPEIIKKRGTYLFNAPIFGEENLSNLVMVKSIKESMKELKEVV